MQSDACDEMGGGCVHLNGFDCRRLNGRARQAVMQKESGFDSYRLDHVVCGELSRCRLPMAPPLLPEKDKLQRLKHVGCLRYAYCIFII